MPNSKAKFYYRSYIDQDLDGYTITDDYDPTVNINDRRKDTVATSCKPPGHDTDGTEVSIVADMHTERAIDTIFLKSNFKTFTVYYLEDEATGSTGGGDYYEITSYASNASDFLEISFAEINTSAIKIVCTHTITANEEKEIYALEITQALGELSVELPKDMRKKHKRTDFENIYGGSVQVVKYPNRGKLKLDLAWDNMTTADYAIYAMLKTQSLIDAYLVYFCFSDDYDLLDDEALYLVNDIEEKEATPSSEAITAGVKGEMKLREC